MYSGKEMLMYIHFFCFALISSFLHVELARGKAFQPTLVVWSSV